MSLFLANLPSQSESQSSTDDDELSEPTKDDKSITETDFSDGKTVTEALPFYFTEVEKVAPVDEIDGKYPCFDVVRRCSPMD